MREVERNIKKKYYRPEIISVEIDLIVCNIGPISEETPVEPGEGDGVDYPGGNPVSSYDGNSKYIFPDSPESDNPFGGSTPNYR